MFAPALALLVAAPAHAQEITVVVDPDLAALAGVDAAAVEQQIREASGGTLKLDEPQAFLEQMATANTFATKGMGVDYASNPQRFFAGGALGTAVNGAGFTFARGDGELPQGGFAFQASAAAGLNLGILAGEDTFLRRFVLSANGLWGAGLSGPFDATLYNVGAHLQWKLIRGPLEGPVAWGGIDLTSGYEISSYKLELAQAVPVEAEALSWEAEGRFDVLSESHSVPIEVSSNLRLAMITLYAGGAVDLRRSAASSGEIELDGALTASAGGQDVKIGNMTASYGMRADLPTEYVPRIFTGAQINIFWLKVYGHLNVGFDDTYAGHLGARVAL